MAKASDLRVLFGALAGVGLGGVALLTVVPIMAPSTDLPGPIAPSGAPAADLAVDAGIPTADAAEADPAPRFDTVRVAPDGTGLVAGQAEPGTEVAVLAGEEVAGEATADADGRFVAFLALAPSAEPRALSLRDGSGGLSRETVIVAPTGEVVAGGTGLVEGAEPTDRASAEGTGRTSATGSGLDVADETGAATRDLPMDRPTPEIALADGSAAIGRRDGNAGVPDDASAERSGAGSPGMAGPSGAAEADRGAMAEPPEEGAVMAGTNAGQAGSADDGPAAKPGEGSDGTAPTVQAIGPGGSSALNGAGGRADGPSAGPASPATVAAAVRPMAGGSADVPPDHVGVPAVGGSPGALPGIGEAAGQAAVLLSDAEGVRVIQPALAPGADAETLSTVALDAIAYGSAGEVLLSGRASGGGAVRVYLDNRPVGDAPVGADGQWSAQIAGSDAGTYTLRVDQLDAGGEVMSRIETPFLREAEGALADLVSQAQEAGQTIAMRTVQPGNTLWAIARDRYGEPLMYVQVFEMNRDRIRDPDLIYPGQVFVLPATAGR